jgi:GNAT superfamily N-acetyltransferase
MATFIRTIQPHDYEPAIALFVAAYPDRSRETDSWLSAETQEAARRWVAVDDTEEQVVGYSSIWSVRLNKLRMDLVIHPDWRGRGIGTRMLKRLLEGAHAAGAATLQARAEADADDSLAFLHRRGFVETMRMHRLVLRVEDANLIPFADFEHRLAARDIVITTFAEEQARDSASWEKLCDLYNAVQSGWPDPDPGPMEPLTVGDLRDLFNRCNLIPDAFFIAKQREIYVGFTGGIGTGVRPASRNQGVATALKMCAITYAREHGQTTLHTASGNPTMILVNEKLGYRRTTTEIRLVKVLHTTEN